MQRKYRWEEWFGQPTTTIVRGVDYNCSQSTMVQSIRNRASLDKVRVRIIDTDNSIIIRVIDETTHPDKTALPRQHEPPALAPTA